jgi:hypothetical protein
MYDGLTEEGQALDVEYSGSWPVLQACLGLGVFLRYKQ